MNFSRAAALALLGGLALSGAHPAAAAPTVFTFTFDAAGLGNYGVPQPPFVGTGTLIAATDPGDGTFALPALGPLDFSFTVNGDTFTQADVISIPALTEVVLASGPTGQTLQFTDNGAPGYGAGGLYEGSLDLENASGAALSFEPGYTGDDVQYAEVPSGGKLQPSSFGNYQGRAAVPEPSSAALLGLGLAPALLLVKARRKGSRAF